MAATFNFELPKYRIPIKYNRYPDIFFIINFPGDRKRLLLPLNIKKIDAQLYFLPLNFIGASKRLHNFSGNTTGLNPF